MKLLFADIRDPEEGYRQAIDKACTEANPIRQEEADRVKRWPYTGRHLM